MHAIILRRGAGLSDRCSPPRCGTRVVTRLSHRSVVPRPPELGECRFVCETVRKVAVQWPARWPAGMPADREQEMQLPSVSLIQRKSTALTNVCSDRI
eukprot:COSAG01_NODE_762_length_13792_cov_19.126707_6_plen_98_part_00